MKKLLIRFFLFFFGGVILLGGTGWLLTIIYGDDIKNYFVSKLNEYLNTEIKVESVEFSVFEKFPDASVNFHNVVAMSAPGFNTKAFGKTNTDTLLVTEDLYFQFSLLDIFSKEYKIKSIHADNGRAWIYIDPAGKDNYHFWKESESEDSTSFRLDLEDIRLSKFTVRFNNKAQDLSFHGYTEDFSISGKFQDDQYDLETSGGIAIYKLVVDKVNYVNAERTSVSIDLAVDNDKYTIRKGTLKLNQMKFALTGFYASADESSELNLLIKGDGLDVKSFMSILPESVKKKTGDYESTGDFFFEASIKGEVRYDKSPHISARFGISNGTISNNRTNLSLTSVFCQGEFSNGDNNSSHTTALILDTLHAVSGKSEFSGSYSMDNFTSPMVRLKMEGLFDLTELRDFMGIDTLEIMDGTLKADFSFQGKVADISNITAQDYNRAHSEGKAEIIQATIKFRNSDTKYSAIFGGFTFRNNDVRIDSLRFRANEDDYVVSGYFRNLISYLMLDDQSLGIDARVRTKQIDLGKFMESEGGGGGIPSNISLSATINVDRLIYNKFTAERVSGFVELKENTLTFSGLTFEASGGKVSSDGAALFNRDGSLTLQLSASLKSIQIAPLFKSFDNFGQEFIQDKHLKGILTADVNMSASWDKDLNLDEKSLIVNANIDIANGELIGFEPMLELSDYISVSELRHIKFARLKNDILIRDRKIIIPQMEISSTAFNIEISGEHTFDNKIDYKLRVLLSEVLANKAKKAKKENEEFGIVEDDGLGRTSIYLSITGTTDDYKITYDTKAVKEHIKESFKQEKENLKTILNEEFGWFKNDSAIIKQKEKKEEIKKPQFMIEWDEEEPEEDQSDKKKP